MITGPEILLLPPPARSGWPGTDARPDAAIAGIAPADRPRPKTGEASAPDRSGAERSGARALRFVAAGAQHGRPEQRPAADAESARPLEGHATSSLAFRAQQIAQEVLSAGLHREPWDLGDAAYRRAGAEPPFAAAVPLHLELTV